MIANIIEQLGINSTLWIQLVVFTVLFILLNTIYFQPFLKLIQKREAMTDGFEDEAKDFNAQVTAKQAKYDEQVKAAILAAREQANVIVDAAKKESNSELEKIKSEVKQKIESARSEIAKDSRETVTELKSEVDNIADLFVEKLTNAKVKA